MHWWGGAGGPLLNEEILSYPLPKTKSLSSKIVAMAQNLEFTPLLKVRLVHIYVVHTQNAHKSGF